MKVVCISDTHNQHKDISVPAGDVLIHAGDGTGTGTSAKSRLFCTGWIPCHIPIRS